MARGSLPGYVWVNKEQVYRKVLMSGAVNGVVGRDEIVAVLKQLAEKSAQMLGDLAMALAESRITENDAVLAGTLLLKDLYNANSALALGGWQQMDARAWGANGQLLRIEYSYWRKFAQDIMTGDLSEAQIRQRAALYIGKAYSRFWAEDRILKLANPKIRFETWIDTELPNECADCYALAGMGKVPKGTFNTVPGAGKTICLSACRCILVYS